MPDYNSVCCNRCEKSGGGVGLYIRNSLSFIKRLDLISDENIYESVFVEISQPVGKNIVIGVVISPQMLIHEFLVTLLILRFLH